MLADLYSRSRPHPNRRSRKKPSLVGTQSSLRLLTGQTKLKYQLLLLIHSDDL